jgi:hypothetical protein
MHANIGAFHAKAAQASCLHRRPRNPNSDRGAKEQCCPCRLLYIPAMGKTEEADARYVKLTPPRQQERPTEPGDS